LQKIDPVTTEKIQAIIDKLRLYADGKESFTFVVDDPTGG